MEDPVFVERLQAFLNTRQVQGLLCQTFVFLPPSPRCSVRVPSVYLFFGPVFESFPSVLVFRSKVRYVVELGEFFFR